MQDGVILKLMFGMSVPKFRIIDVAKSKEVVITTNVVSLNNSIIGIRVESYFKSMYIINRWHQVIAELSGLVNFIAG